MASEVWTYKIWVGVKGTKTVQILATRAHVLCLAGKERYHRSLLDLDRSRVDMRQAKVWTRRGGKAQLLS